MAKTYKKITLFNSESRKGESNIFAYANLHTRTQDKIIKHFERNKKSMKKVLLILISILLIGLVAGCNGDTAAPEPAPEPAPEATPEPAPEPDPEPDVDEPADTEQEPVTLQWAVWDIGQVAYYAPLIEAYREIAPHVTIEMVDLGTDEWNEIVQMHLIGGHDYDIVKVRDVPGYVNQVNANLLTPLDDMISARGIDLGDFMGIPEQFVMDGQLFALPFRSDFWVVFYNKDLFDAAGVDYPTNQMTFDAWTDIIREVTHGEGTDKVWGNFFHNWRSTTTLFGVLDGRHTVNDGNYEFLIPFYEAVLALEDGEYVPRRTDMVAGGVHHRDMWAPQQIAMVNMGTWFTADTLLSDFRWGIAAYPVPTSADYGATLGQVTQLAIPRNANHPEEAMDFIAFVSGPQGAEILASVGQLPSMMTDAALDLILAVPGFPQDETTRGALRPRAIFLEQPPHVDAGEINAILNEHHVEIMDRTISIEDGIALMGQRVTALLS